MSEDKPALAKKAMYDAINTQMKESNPAAVKQTYDRLLGLGHTEDEVMQLISSALTIELFEVMNKGQMFDENRYSKNLEALPKLPWGENK